jgi:hypothetical protein
MKTLRQLLFLICAVSFVGIPQARAQDLQVQQFRPMPGQQTNYFHGFRADTPDAGRWELGLVLNYARNPLVIQTRPAGESAERTGELITQQLTLDLLAAIAVTDWFEFGVALPVYLHDAGNRGQGFGAFELQDAPNRGVGDLRLVPRFRLAQWGGDRGDRFTVGFSADFLLPTASNGNAYQGEDFRVEPRFALDLRLADWAVWSFNAGVMIRPEDVTVDNISAGHAATFGTAAAFALNDSGSVLLVPEIFGLVSIAPDDDIDLEEVPLEARLGLKWFPVGGLMIEGGAGAGIIEGYGTPDWRLFAGVSYSAGPEDESVCNNTRRWPDDDQDGVCETPSHLGICDICRPRLDGDFPDPWEIMDYVRRDDSAHYWRYSYYPGMSTDDSVDEDNDGMPDACDICRPADACEPGTDTSDSRDADGDGLPDACDQCPNGRDLSDVDGDCIADCLDLCPEDPETWNNLDDEDGCPEEFECSEALSCPENLTEFPFVAQEYGGVPFFFDYDIYMEFSQRGPVNGYDQSTNEVLIEQIVAIVEELAPCLEYDLVAEGHTDTDGNLEYNTNLGLNRAGHVRDLLIAAGMRADRIEVMTRGESEPLNADDQGDDYAPGNRENRRVILRYECREGGERGPEAFEPTCAPPSVGQRCR